MNTPDAPSALFAPGEDEPLEDTRNRLLRCAVQIFDRKGYAATSVREIAKLAGVAKPALYYHFGSKEGLLDAILEKAAREFSEVMFAGVSRPGTARHRLVALCEDVYGLFERNVPVARVAHAMFFGPRDVAPAYDITAFERGLRLAIQRIIEDGQAARELRPMASGDVTLTIMGIIDVCTDRQLHPGLEPVGSEGLRRMLDVLFEGLLIERLA